MPIDTPPNPSTLLDYPEGQSSDSSAMQCAENGTQDYTLTRESHGNIELICETGDDGLDSWVILVDGNTRWIYHNETTARARFALEVAKQKEAGK